MIWIIIIIHTLLFWMNFLLFQYTTYEFVESGPKKFSNIFGFDEAGLPYSLGFILFANRWILVYCGWSACVKNHGISWNVLLLIPFELLILFRLLNKQYALSNSIIVYFNLFGARKSSIFNWIEIEKIINLWKRIILCLSSHILSYIYLSLKNHH